jgi:hypothetical protein
MGHAVEHPIRDVALIRAGSAHLATPRNQQACIIRRQIASIVVLNSKFFREVPSWTKPQREGASNYAVRPSWVALRPSLSL